MRAPPLSKGAVEEGQWGRRPEKWPLAPAFVGQNVSRCGKLMGSLWMGRRSKSKCFKGATRAVLLRLWQGPAFGCRFEHVWRRFSAAKLQVFSLPFVDGSELESLCSFSPTFVDFFVAVRIQSSSPGFRMQRPLSESHSFGLPSTLRPPNCPRQCLPSLVEESSAAKRLRFFLANYFGPL